MKMKRRPSGALLVVEISRKQEKFGRIEKARRAVAPPGKEDAMDASTYHMLSIVLSGLFVVIALVRLGRKQ